MFQRWAPTLFVGLTCLFSIVGSGCSDKKFDTRQVSGVVKFADGSVVSSGRVEFFSESAKVSARGAIQPDGTFVMGTETADDGAVPGEHKVIIMQIVAPSGSGVTPRDHGAHIDRRFASFGSSGLTFTVEDGRENFAEFIVTKED